MRAVQVVESIVVVDLDRDNKITKLVDQWDGKEPPSGWGASLLRRFSARSLPWIPYLGHVPRLGH